MRIRIQMQMDGVHLPYDYRRGIQAFLYSCLNHQYAKELHENESGNIKLYTFSNLLGKNDRDENGMVFNGAVSLYVASPDVYFLQQVFEKIKSTEHIDLYGNFIPVYKINGIENHGYRGVVNYHTISPITVYLTDENGMREYVSPEDYLFSDLIKENIGKKYIQVYGEEMSAYFNMYQIENVKKRRCTFKKVTYIAYDADFKIDTTTDVHDIIQDCGLGVRNAAGFGMISVRRKK